MAVNRWLGVSKKPLVIAHRGGALLAQENSRAAFRAAEKANADAIETDVRITRDGILVNFHDADLQRLCGDRRSVAEIDFRTLKSLVPAIMTLAEAIASSAPLGLLLDVKLMDRTYLPSILAEISRADAAGRTLLGLRDIALVKAARDTAADIAILALASDPELHQSAAQAGANWFRLWQGELSPGRAASIRGAGMRLAVMVGQPRDVPLPEYPRYPVGLVDAEGLKQIAIADPDAIMLDDPHLLTRP